ncbi:DUF4302 domain-containing protein [Algibacter amylolyticus]|uniref:DUF4302 domain-containing protein n=1 Tax=Algibacter amylolyticus TaxID=1608400 RepID=A0A5M7B9N4_9FLAO|nr:DUF4302 domain-containing protein [Algibacter amylolyticus]KAA5826172.1 DUF4302 domain-containing protein [Algibacter amylolyticus]MBB5268372.1 hypothetical protein [Algibacter amylolyticus]TSJ80210.1 DUF4302 domain-containing protein [Algibacter amylolyticus]
MKKYIKYILSLLLLTVVLNSCEVDRTEAIFEEAPSDRIQKNIEELRTLLLSQSQGFSGVYFPNNSVVGGVNFHMNFTEDLRVKITSDFKSNTELTDTRYDVVTGTTAAELVFTSGSRHITDLIQDGAQGFNTFYGGNSFQYVGEENGVITFKEVRSDGVFVISPSGFTDFETESVASADITYTNREVFTEVDCETASVYDNLVLAVDNAGQSTNYILNYDSTNFFFDAGTTDEEGVSSRQGLGVAFTLIDGEQAILISPALEVGGNSFENFILDSESDKVQYVASVNGATATISQTSLSAPTGEDIMDLPGSIYVYDVADGTNPLLSPCFRDLVIEQINTNLDNRFGAGTLKFSFYYLFLNLEGGCSNLAIFLEDANGGLYRANYCIVANIESNTVFFDYLGPYSGSNDAFFEENLQPLMDFFSGPQGLLYTNEGSFSASINSYLNASGSFTSLDTPSLRSYGYFFP